MSDKVVDTPRGNKDIVGRKSNLYYWRNIYNMIFPFRAQKNQRTNVMKLWDSKKNAMLVRLAFNSVNELLNLLIFKKLEIAVREAKSSCRRIIEFLMQDLPKSFDSPSDLFHSYILHFFWNTNGNKEKATGSIFKIIKK